MNIASVICGNLSKWIRSAKPATDSDIRELMKWSTVPLPSEFIEVLKVSNGGECSLAISPWWLQLWATNEISEHNAGYETEKWFPDYIGFGSSGGGEMFAFRKGAGAKVFAIPFCNSDPNDIQVIAERFADFVSAIGVEAQSRSRGDKGSR